MNTEQLAIFIGEKIKSYRKQFGWTQLELGKKIGMGKNAISNYEKGVRTPKKDTMFELANAFKVSIDDLFPPRNTTNTPSPDAKNDTVQAINDTVVQLHPERQENVREYATEQLDEQEKESAEIREELAEYNSDKVVPFSRKEKEFESLIVHGLESAGDGIWQEEDADIEVRIPKSEIPDEFDDLAMVIGDSMHPKLHNGDILFVKFTKQVEMGQIGVFRTSKGNFVKKLQQDRLESLNPDYEDIYFNEDEFAEAIGVVEEIYRK